MLSRTVVGDAVFHQRLNRTFVGTGDVLGCLRLLNQFVHKVEPSDCNPKPCAIGSFYQPTIDPSISFYAIGSFRYALEAIDAVTSDGIFVPQTGFVKASEFCAKVSSTRNNLKQCRDLDTKLSRLDSTRIHFTKVLVLVSRPEWQDAADFT